MIKILHTADLHIKQYGDERWKALQKLIEIGKREKIDIFVISGDLFNSGVNAENLRGQVREIFSNNNFKVLIIPGNHDKESYRSDMYFGEDTVVLNNPLKPFERENIRIVGIPFEQMEGAKLINKIRFLKKDVLIGDKTNVLLYHGELLDTFFSRRDFGDEGEGRYMPVKLSYFKDLNIDYVLAGHFHSRFDVQKLENGGYFVYPGSPISITKREIGPRKVNIFQVGKSPKEYLLDTPHFEEVAIEFDPIQDKDPLEIIEKRISNLRPEASIILTIKGFINGKIIGMSETELIKRIKEITTGKCIEEHCEVKDIQTILDDSLFKNFMNKLAQTDYEKEKKRQMRDVAIKAITEVKL